MRILSACVSGWQFEYIRGRCLNIASWRVGFCVCLAGTLAENWKGVGCDGVCASPDLVHVTLSSTWDLSECIGKSGFPLSIWIWCTYHLIAPKWYKTGYFLISEIIMHALDPWGNQAHIRTLRGVFSDHEQSVFNGIWRHGLCPWLKRLEGLILMSAKK